MVRFTVFTVVSATFFLQGYTHPLAHDHRDVQDHTRGLFDGPQCFLTIRELAGRNLTTGQIYKRQIELNWANAEVHPGDWVGLFDYDPADQNDRNHALAALFRVNATQTDGYAPTDVQLELGSLTEITQATCYKYWIAFFRAENSTPSLTNCYHLYPSWMNDLKDVIREKPLHSLMIPGTHGAGAWKIYDPLTDDLISKITYNQEEDIWNQLISGIRYLDIRVAHYPDTPEVFWVNHDIVRIRPLTTVLDDVLRFCTERKEVVILDFHRFPVGFTDDTVHRKLYDYVSAKIGGIMAPKNLSPSVTLAQLWDAGKYVVLTYSDDYYRQQELLWPPLTQAWGDKNQIEDLESYLREIVSQYGCRGQLWAAMAELTPRPIDFLTRNLRTMANEVNKPATRWYQELNMFSKSNIITTDYYEGNDVIETCITVNRNNGVAC